MKLSRFAIAMASVSTLAACFDQTPTDEQIKTAMEPGAAASHAHILSAHSLGCKPDGQSGQTITAWICTVRTELEQPMYLAGKTPTWTVSLVNDGGKWTELRAQLLSQ